MNNLFLKKVVSKHSLSISEIPIIHKNIINDYKALIAQAKISHDKSAYKETSFKANFIEKILIQILGYKRLGTEDYTLREEQGIKDYQPKVTSRSVDVALGFFGKDKDNKIIAPFELKGLNYCNLDAVISGKQESPVAQSWNYAINNGGTKWVLVSNCKEIRLYHYGTGKSVYEKFDVEALDKLEEYARFITLLSETSLLHGKTQEILDETLQAGKQITDELYRDYKDLRSLLIAHITDKNDTYKHEDIVEISQKILDRVLFITFAQSKGLLSKKDGKTIVDYTCQTLNPYYPMPLWKNFIGLFEAINSGNSLLSIPAYNGGLFKSDERINNLTIEDSFCSRFKELAKYDFESEVSVEILGHIFEQSIEDLELLKNPQQLDKKQSKRKKDGVFYTPPFITNYIIEHTIGKWCEQKRQEFGFYDLPEITIFHEERIKANKSLSKDRLQEANLTDKQILSNIEQHKIFWGTYQKAVSNIKVLDPACGSGAFLNAVFDFLMREGKLISDNLFRLGVQDLFGRWDTHILKNNIFGVDINKESVEITQLSLWLKTLNNKEKLTYLGDNIKCGNSLIEDKEIAGDLAFNWNSEFKDIMDKGGFDIIVGNPPYVNAKHNNFSDKVKEYYYRNYQVAEYQLDTFILFIEKANYLLKDDGICGYIIPNSILGNMFVPKIRKFLLDNTSIKTIALCDNVFEQASVDTMILITDKKIKQDNQIEITQIKDDKSVFLRAMPQENFLNNQNYIFNISADEKISSILKKIEPNTINLENMNAEISTGIKEYQVGKGTPPQTKKDKEDLKFHADFKKDKTYQLELRGYNINRYSMFCDKKYISYGVWLAEPRNPKFFIGKRIIVRQVPDTKNFIATCIKDDYILDQSLYIAKLVDDLYDYSYILTLLNSRLLHWYFQNTHNEFDSLFPKIKIGQFKSLPFKKLLPNEQAPFIQKCEIMLKENEKLQTLVGSFYETLETRLAVKKKTKNLQKWYLLSYKEFLAELKKQKIEISLKDNREWQDYFSDTQKEVLEIVKIIETTDKEIDQMVYKIYELTDDEIKLVEQN